ncbi:MAG: toll/interleukin-1 receptor domain-containing protein [Gammaproteobacteria bacterium]
MPTAAPEFDVLLSFADAERAYARAIHDIAAANGVRVFLDEEHQHEIWGKNLIEYLDKAYRERGASVLILISKAYTERAYTRVERRAALDRMIEQTKEYILPVKVDDSWIEGLPKATAYLDLRTKGVLGVCEMLVRKMGKWTGKLAIPPNLAIPRVPLGRLSGDQLATYLLELTVRPEVTTFGALIYDESNVALRKLLRDRDYWDALDKVSGPHFEVFGILDAESYEYELDERVGMITEISESRTKDRGYYFSELLKRYFGEKKRTLVYPSFLLFLAEGGSIKLCWLIPLKKGALDKTYQQLLKLFEAIASGIEEAGGPGTPASNLRLHLKKKLLALKYTLYIQRPPVEAQTAIRELAEYVEEENS